MSDRAEIVRVQHDATDTPAGYLGIGTSISVGTDEHELRDPFVASHALDPFVDRHVRRGVGNGLRR